MSTSTFGTNENSSKELPESVFPIHRLSNEILIKIIEKMSPEDRNALAQIDDRMCGLEKMAGHRHLDGVDFFADNDNSYLSSTIGSIDELFYLSTPAHEISTHFKHAKTKALAILGRLDRDAERMLNNATKTLDFKELLCQFIQQYSCIEEIQINWIINSEEESKKLLMNLPSMVKFRKISLWSIEKFMDDELFLNLLNKTSGYIVFDCFNTYITSSGIGEAFQMVYSGKREGRIEFTPTISAWKRYARELRNLPDDFKSNMSNNKFEFTHIKSGARFSSLPIIARIEMIHGPSKSPSTP